MTDTLNLKDVTDLGYDMVKNRLKDMLDMGSVRDGTARWVPCPTTIGAFNYYEDEDLGVRLTMTMTSEQDLTTLTYMCANAMTYALYTGCVDGLKRQPRQLGEAYRFSPGTYATASADVALVHIEMRLDVMHPAELRVS